MTKQKPKAKPKAKHEEERSSDQARTQFESIKEMMTAYEHAESGSDEQDAAQQTIWENPLSLEVRSDWRTIGDSVNAPTEYRILLCTGGPAVQIVGDLNEHGEPESARLEHQDWFTPWTPLSLTSEEREVLVAYAQCFSFGG